MESQRGGQDRMKVKLPREVAEAIETLRLPSHDYSNYSIIVMMNDPARILPEIHTINNHIGQDGMHPDDFISALVNGYEVEETPEDQILKIYQSHSGGEVNSLSWQYRMEIRTILDLLNVQIKGVNV